VLKSTYGKHVVCEASGDANANRVKIGPWERMIFIPVGLNQLKIYNPNLNKYLRIVKDKKKSSGYNVRCDTKDVN